MNYKDLILSHNPVAYWRLGEVSGTTAYDETNSYNGTYTGGVTLNEKGALTNDVNKSVLFDGSTGRVDTNFSYTAGTPISVEAWIYPTFIDNNHYIFTTHFPDNSIFNQQYSGISILTCGQGAGRPVNSLQASIGSFTNTTFRVSTQNTINLNRWNHLIVTFTGGVALNDITIYVNGSEVSYQSNISGITGVPSNGIRGSLGGHVYNTQRFYSGSIDELAVYDYVLMPDHIKEHYAKGIKGKGIYWLKDEFKTDESAPITTPRICEPGPGILKISDPTNIISINNQQLSILSDASPSGVNITGEEYERKVGRSLMMINTGRTAPNGWRYGLDVGNGNITNSWVLTNSTTLRTSVANALVSQDTIPNSGNLHLYKTLLSKGALSFFRVGDTGPFTLAWIDNTQTGNPLFRMTRLANSAMNVKWDDIYIGDLGDIDSRFNDKSELATSKIDGIVPSGATFTHETNCKIEWTQTILPVGGTTKINFRYQDSNNYWYIRISAEGHFILFERINGVDTGRASLLSSVTAGANIKVIVNGSVIQGYLNDNLSWTYSNATSLQTYTQGVRDVFSGAQGGTINNLRAWPITQDLTYTGDYGLATSRIPGSVSRGQTFTHEPDFIMEYVLTSLTTSGQTHMGFRIQDSDNCWFVWINSDGRLALYEWANRATAPRASSAIGAVASGDRIVVIAEGPVIRIFCNNTLLINYASAFNFQTATQGGRATPLSGSGENSASYRNLVTYPRYVDINLKEKPKSLFSSQLFEPNLFGGNL